MKIKNLLLGLIIVFALGACSDDDEPKKDDEGTTVNIDCQTFVTEAQYQPVLDELLAASQAYSTDQSSENCQAYYSSMENYITTWKSFVDKCYPEASAQWSSYWSTYQSQIDQLTCE